MKKPLIIIFLLSAFLFFFNLASRDFWAPDEGDFAQIAKELDNDIVTPHLNNEPYGEKPPFFYYVTYLSSKAFFWAGHETSMRIPSGLFAMLSVFFLFLTLRRSEGQGLLSTAFMLITTPLFYWQARYLQVDMVFASLVVCALLCFIRFHDTKNRSFYYLFFLFTGLAFMTKGPLALALVAPIVLIFLFTERDWTALKGKETYLGMLLFLAIILPWYFAVYLKEGFPYLYENIIRQNFTRFFDAWSHKRPIYYYFTTFPLDFFPWILFLPGGIYLSIKRWKSDPPGRFFLIWFVWMFFFLSLSSGKISKYMLPALPAAAFLASAIVRKKDSYAPYVYGFLAVLFCVLAFGLFTYRTDLYREFTPERVNMGLISIAVTILLAIFIKRGRMSLAFYTVVACMAAFYTIGNTSVYGKLNVYKSSKPLCQNIRSLTDNGTPWVYYGSIRGVYVYYVGRFAIHIDEHDKQGLKTLSDKERNFYVLTRKRDMEELQSTIAGMELILEEKVGSTSMVLLLHKENP